MILDPLSSSPSLFPFVARRSSVITATGYGLHGPRIESPWRGDEIFRFRPYRLWSSPNLPYLVCVSGVERLGRGVAIRLPSVVLAGLLCGALYLNLFSFTCRS